MGEKLRRLMVARATVSGKIKRLDVRRLVDYRIAVRSKSYRKPSSKRTMIQPSRRSPGDIRDAVLAVVASRPRGASVAEISEGVAHLIGRVPPSSIRSYLRLNSETVFRREQRGVYRIADAQLAPKSDGT